MSDESKLAAALVRLADESKEREEKLRDLAVRLAGEPEHGAEPAQEDERPVEAHLFEAHAARQRAALEPFFKKGEGDSA